MSQKFTSSEEEMIRIMRDPVLWAKTHMNAEPRWYQEQVLRHPHNRTALRMGRRTGKCIAEGQRVVNADTGEYLPVEDLFKRQFNTLFSLNNQYKISKDQSFRVERNGIKPVYGVKVGGGAEVELTGNHPVLTIKGWKEVDDLEIGEYIAVPKKLPVFGKHAVTKEEAQLKGFVLGAYSHTKQGLVLKFHNESIRNDIVEIFKGAGVPIFPKSSQNYFLIDKKKLFTEITKEEHAKIPEEVFQYSEEALRAFLAAMFDTRSWLKTKPILEIGFQTLSPHLVKDLKHLLLRFGIRASIEERKKGNTIYNILLLRSRDEIATFCKKIGKYGLQDYDDFLAQDTGTRSYSNTIPQPVWERIEYTMKQKNLKPSDVTGPNERFRKKINLPEEKAYQYGLAMKDEWLTNIGSSDVVWEKVMDIKSLGQKMTYDVSMPMYHNLVVEDVCVHNTWTMRTHMLWAAYTNIGGQKKEGYTDCLVATPYDSQARDIFDGLKKDINDNPILKDSVVSITQSPYRIKFKNGSTITLRTAGTRSSSGAASLRGLRADYLYLDKYFVPSSREASRITM